MALNGMMSITDMSAEIWRQCGRLQVLNPAVPGNVIERAINDAYLAIVLKFKLPQFEVTPPYYFQQDKILSTIGATNPANSSTILTTDPAVVTFGQRLVEGALQFSSPTFTQGQQLVTIVGVAIDTPVPGTHTITVAPQIQAAHLVPTPFLAVLVRYNAPAPVGTPPEARRPMFYLYDLSCVSRRIPCKQVDVRVFDRSAALIGMAVYYARVNEEFQLFPGPYSQSPFIDTFRLRYAVRPEYKSGAETLFPLPEEWQRIVIMNAFAMILDDQREHQRAEATRDASDKLATEMMKPWIEEIEDADAALTPRLLYW
jgi:hypothetical protein